MSCMIMTLSPLDQCPIPWEKFNVGSNVTFEYSISGPRLIYNHPSGSSPKGEIISVCASNGSWYPNPAEIDLCTVPNQGLCPQLRFSPIFYLPLYNNYCEGDCDNAGATTMGSNEKHNHELLGK